MSSSNGGSRHTPRWKSIDSIREPSEFKLVIVAFWHVAEEFIPELRRVAPAARIVVDSIDLHFVREMRNELRYEPGADPRTARAPASGMSG